MRKLTDESLLRDKWSEKDIFRILWLEKELEPFNVDLGYAEKEKREAYLSLTHDNFGLLNDYGNDLLHYSNENSISNGKIDVAKRKMAVLKRRSHLNISDILGHPCNFDLKIKGVETLTIKKLKDFKKRLDESDYEKKVGLAVAKALNPFRGNFPIGCNFGTLGAFEEFLKVSKLEACKSRIEYPKMLDEHALRRYVTNNVSDKRCVELIKSYRVHIDLTFIEPFTEASEGFMFAFLLKIQDIAELYGLEVA